MRRPHLYVVPPSPPRASRSDLFGGLAIIVALVVSVYVVVSLTHSRTRLAVSADFGRTATGELGR